MLKSSTQRTHARTVPLAALLAALAMLGPFSMVTYMPSFPDIERTFSVTPLQMQLTVSAYLFTFAVMALFHGAISDSFGRRSVILVNLAVFAAASVACAVAQDFTHLLWARALQGFSAGAGMVIGRAIVRDCYSGHEAQRMMSTVTMIFGAAPAMGPVIGGWLQTAFGWRSVFVFLALYAVLILAYCYWRLAETLPQAGRQSIALRPLTANYLKLLGSLRFGLLSSALAFNFAGMFLYISSAPAIIYKLLSLNENQFAWLFVPLIGGFVLGAFLSGRVAGRLTPFRTISIGYGIMFVAAATGLGYHALYPPAVPWTVLPVMMYTIGSSLVMPNLTLFALDLFPHNRGLAASLQVFQNSLFNTVTAGAVSPFVSGSGLGLAATMALFLMCGAACTLAYFRLPPLLEQAQ